MIVFLRGIPPQTKRHDIKKFIEPAMKGGFFAKKGHIKRMQILVLKDLALNQLEYHGMVTIEPDEVALRVIKKLNRQKFMGKHIAVREFVKRDWHNDRRLNSKTAGIVNRENRQSDRRRGSRVEVIDDITTMFSGRQGFNRKLMG